jgi:hypothetical protein
MEEGGGLGRQLAGSDLGRPRNEKRWRGRKKGARAAGVGPAGQKPSKGGRKEKFLSFLFFSEFSNYFQTEF